VRGNPVKPLERSPSETTRVDEQSKRLNSITSALKEVEIFYADDDPAEAIRVRIGQIQEQHDLQLQRARSDFEESPEFQEVRRNSANLLKLEAAIKQAGLTISCEDSVDKIAASFKASITPVSADDTDLLAQYEKLKSTYRDLTAKLNQYETAAQRQTAFDPKKLEQERANWLAEKEKLEIRIASTLATSKKQLDDADRRTQEAYRSRDELRLKVTRLDDEIDGRKRFYADLEAERDKLIIQSRNRAERLEILQADRSREVSELKATIRRKDGEIEEQRGVLQGQAGQVSDLRAQITALQDGYVTWSDFCKHGSPSQSQLQESFGKAERRLAAEEDLASEFKQAVRSDFKAIDEVMSEWLGKDPSSTQTSNEYATLIDCTIGRSSVEDERNLTDLEIRKRLAWRGVVYSTASSALNIVMKHMNSEIVVPKTGDDFAPELHDQKVGRQENLVQKAVPGRIARCVRVGVKRKEADASDSLFVYLRAIVVRYTWDEARVAEFRRSQEASRSQQEAILLPDDNSTVIKQREDRGTEPENQLTMQPNQGPTEEASRFRAAPIIEEEVIEPSEKLDLRELAPMPPPRSRKL